MEREVMKQILLVSLLAMFAAAPALAQQVPPEKKAERVIYIPYRQLEKLMKADAGIYLPYTDYQKLLAELDDLRQQPPELPKVVLISDAVYRARVNGDFIEVKASYTLNILKEGWHGLGLGFGGVAIREAKLAGEPALLHWQEAEQRYELVVKSDKSEEQALEVDFVTPVVKSPDAQNSASFSVPRSPIARLFLEIPLGAEQKALGIKVDLPGGWITRQTSRNGSVEIEAILGNAGDIKIFWEAEAQRKVEIKTVLRAENMSRLEIGENSLRLAVDVRYDVIQGELDSLKLKVPEDFTVREVKSVKGAPVGPWSREGDILAVNFLEKLVNREEKQPDLILRVELEKSITSLARELSVPSVEILGAESEEGIYTIVGNEFYTLKEIPGKTGIMQIDVADLPDYVRSDVQFAYRYFHRPFTLKVELEKIKLEYETHTNVYAYLDKSVVKLYACLQYDVKKSQIFSARVQVPKDFSLLDVRAMDLDSPEQGNYLFNLGTAHQQDLNAGKVTDGIRRTFQGNKYPLAEAAVARVKKQSAQWTIIDGPKVYLVVRSGNALNVYDGHCPNQIQNRKIEDRGELLFRLDLKQEEDLNAAKVSQELRQAFDKEKRALAESASVKVHKTGAHWELSDGEREYVVVRAETALEVYRGGSFLIIVFKKGVRSEYLAVRISMQKKLEGEPEEREIELPVFRVAGAKRETGNVGMEVHPTYRITTKDETKKNVAALDIADLFRVGDPPPFKAKESINLGFQYILTSEDEVIAARFKMEKKKPEVTATVYDYISVEDNALKHDFQICYKVKYASTREFAFSLPEGIAKEVTKDHLSDNRTPTTHKQIEEDRENHRFVYKLETAQDVKDNETYQLNVSYTQKIRSLDTPQPVESIDLATRDTKQEDGFIVVIKKEGNVFLRVRRVEKLEPVDPEDPKYQGKKDGVFKIFKYNEPGYKLEMEIEKLEFEPVLNTVINRLHISTSVNKDYTTNNKATLLILNNQNDRLDFELPDGILEKPMVYWLSSIPSSETRTYRAHELEPYLRPLPLIKIEEAKGTEDKKRQVGQVNIASHVPKNAPCVIVISYRTRLEEGEMGYRGKFSLQPVTFEVPVTNFTWDLGLPQEYEYLWFESDLARDIEREWQRGEGDPTQSAFRHPYTYGIWRVIDPLRTGRAVDTTHIKAGADTGVTAIYDVQGKIFSFSRLRGGGYINVSFSSPAWTRTVELAIFVLACAIIAFLPRFYKVSRLSLVLALSVVALFLSSLNLQGYQALYLPALYGSLAAGAVAVAAVMKRKVGTVEFNAKKPHTLVRDAALPKETGGKAQKDGDQRPAAGGPEKSEGPQGGKQ